MMFVSGEIERMHERDRDCACGYGEHCRKVIKSFTPDTEDDATYDTCLLQSVY